VTADETASMLTVDAGQGRIERDGLIWRVRAGQPWPKRVWDASWPNVWPDPGKLYQLMCDIRAGQDEPSHGETSSGQWIGHALVSVIG